MIGTGKRKAHRLLLPLVLVVCSVLLPPQVTAQGNAETASCTLPPVSLPLFDATPAADIAVATPTLTRDSGSPASPDQIETYRDSLQLLVDCINTGIPAYAYAIFTTGYLASWFVPPDGAYQPALEREIDQVTVPDTTLKPLQIVSIDIVRELDDGRLSGQVVLQSDMTWRDTLVLKKIGETWLIDDVIRESR